MRNVILFLHSSLDGFVEGPNGAMDIGFVAYNEELEKHAREILSTVDTVFWGKGTYEMMMNYWTSVPSNPESTEYELEHAKWIEETSKVVFSTTLEQADWKNSRLVKENIEEEIKNIKKQSGNDIIILGSPRFAHSLMELDLIDVIKITISPVIIGSGLPLFKGLGSKRNLSLVENKTFNSGVIGLTYNIVKS
ncbi:dihydrofolate reductase family protein [Bacillus sp. AFS017336]|uniref:dihydrofolate reductase family protein n=1 Tax=Bacillus sp. AFS017336 TaxID=2033489 RepID=UPI000BEFB34A|nr:dihydrofolate reductase family protein [Bacillus sp. AFS017336]PEL11193.1 dihydrofolate reductase [Bacillus sp. AFS017336]